MIFSAHRLSCSPSLAITISVIMTDYGDDEYEIPLQDQRIFGAGIKRKRVKFVPSSAPTPTISLPITTPARSVGDLYLSLVLPQDSQQAPSEERTSSNTPQDPRIDATSRVCEVCSLPVKLTDDDVVDLGEVQNSEDKLKARPHEASLAHQVCLEHSHPPSNVDRNRKGLAYLSSYGWDPDSRLGLGANGQGIQHPIKTKEKNDKLGLGVVVPKDKDLLKMMKKKDVKLDAGKIRKLAQKDKQRTERLRDEFYRSEDVERYLRRG